MLCNLREVIRRKWPDFLKENLWKLAYIIMENVLACLIRRRLFKNFMAKIILLIPQPPSANTYKPVSYTHLFLDNEYNYLNVNCPLCFCFILLICYFS